MLASARDEYDKIAVILAPKLKQIVFGGEFVLEFIARESERRQVGNMKKLERPKGRPGESPIVEVFIRSIAAV